MPVTEHPFIRAWLRGYIAWDRDASLAALAAAVCGKVDRIILTGGAAHSKRLSGEITKHVSWIAPVEVMAGEFELEALCAGALRVLRGQEKPNTFVWKPQA